MGEWGVIRQGHQPMMEISGRSGMVLSEPSSPSYPSLAFFRGALDLTPVFLLFPSQGAGRLPSRTPSSPLAWPTPSQLPVPKAT